MAEAAITAQNVYRESMGSTTLIIATFSAISTGLWTHGLPNVVGYWCTVKSNTLVGMDTTSATVLRITVMEGATPGTAYVMTRT